MLMKEAHWWSGGADKALKSWAEGEGCKRTHGATQQPLPGRLPGVAQAQQVIWDHDPPQFLWFEMGEKLAQN